MAERAPVALFIYARPDHTRQVLDGLRAEGVPLLYIFSDAPRTPEVQSRVNEVRTMVRSIDWAETHLVEREKNLGLAKSIISGTTQVLREHDRAIVLEDDCVPLAGFYDYMCEALDHYADEPRVWSVSGYLAPAIEVPDDYPHRAMLAPRFSSWGWATWRDRWGHYSNDLVQLHARCRKKRIKLDSCGTDIPAYLANMDVLLGRTDVWALSWQLIHFLNNGFSIIPTTSLIDNIGTDGSGMNSGVDLEGRFTVKPKVAPQVSNVEQSNWPDVNSELAEFVLTGLRKQFYVRIGICRKFGYFLSSILSIFRGAILRGNS